jgi:hypothetical protein
MTTPGEKEREEELEFEKSPNPRPFKPNRPEHPAVTKARLFRLHSARGSMGTYYDLYPEDRLPEREPKLTPSQGRSR